MKRPYQQLRAQLLPAALTLAICGVAHAVSSVSNGSRLYRPCIVCHQPNAWGSPDGAIPNLAGQQVRYLEKQLALFRSGARVDTAMQVVTAHSTFGDQDDIVALASYLSGLEANPHPVKGSGEHLRAGQEMYAHICAACHGVAGRGEPGEPSTTHRRTTLSILETADRGRRESTQGLRTARNDKRTSGHELSGKGCACRLHLPSRQLRSAAGF